MLDPAEEPVGRFDPSKTPRPASQAPRGEPVSDDWFPQAAPGEACECAVELVEVEIGVGPQGSNKGPCRHSGDGADGIEKPAVVECAETSQVKRMGNDRTSEWGVLAGWLGSGESLRGVDLAVLRERLRLVGCAKSALAAFEADVVGEIARQQGDAAAEEILRRDQKRSLSGARKTVKTAARLEWMPAVAGRLADGTITPEVAGLIAEAAQDTDVDQNLLLEAAERESDDLFRRTLKHHVNERTNETELQARREPHRTGRPTVAGRRTAQRPGRRPPKAAPARTRPPPPRTTLGPQSPARTPRHAKTKSDRPNGPAVPDPHNRQRPHSTPTLRRRGWSVVGG